MGKDKFFGQLADVATNIANLIKEVVKLMDKGADALNSNKHPLQDFAKNYRDGVYNLSDPNALGTADNIGNRVSQSTSFLGRIIQSMIKILNQTILAPMLAFGVNGMNIATNSFMTILLNIMLTMGQLIFGILFQPIFTFVQYINENVFSGLSRKFQLFFMGSACYPHKCKGNPSNGVCIYKKNHFSDSVFGGRVTFNKVNMKSKVVYKKPSEKVIYKSYSTKKSNLSCPSYSISLDGTKTKSTPICTTTTTTTTTTPSTTTTKMIPIVNGDNFEPFIASSTTTPSTTTTTSTNPSVTTTTSVKTKYEKAVDICKDHADCKFFTIDEDKVNIFTYDVKLFTGDNKDLKTVYKKTTELSKIDDSNDSNDSTNNSGNENSNPIKIVNKNLHDTDCDKITKRSECQKNTDVCEWKEIDHFCKIQKRNNCNTAAIYDNSGSYIPICKLQNPLLGPSFVKMYNVLTGSAMPLFENPSENENTDVCNKSSTTVTTPTVTTASTK